MYDYFYAQNVSSLSILLFQRLFFVFIHALWTHFLSKCIIIFHSMQKFSRSRVIIEFRNCCINISYTMIKIVISVIFYRPITGQLKLFWKTPSQMLTKTFGLHVLHVRVQKSQNLNYVTSEASLLKTSHN